MFAARNASTLRTEIRNSIVNLERNDPTIFEWIVSEYSKYSMRDFVDGIALGPLGPGCNRERNRVECGLESVKETIEEKENDARRKPTKGLIYLDTVLIN